LETLAVENERFPHGVKTILQRNHTRQTVAQGSPIDSKKLDTKKDKIQF
jgi:hypothetical protein